jgi:hypothetical protein
VQFKEFIDLATILYPVQLVEKQPDSICWLWTKNGVYSASSAYHIQFRCSDPVFDSAKVWKAFAGWKQIASSSSL